MFGGQTWKDRSDLYCQISVFTLSLNVALKLKLRIKYLSAAKWQCATGLSPQDTSWAHTFGIIKRSMGKNKLLLYLITKKKKKSVLCCIFPVLPVPCPFPCLTLSGDVSHLCLMLITALTSFSCLLPTDPFSFFAVFLYSHLFYLFILHFLVLLSLAFFPSA